MLRRLIEMCPYMNKLIQLSGSFHPETLLVGPHARRFLLVILIFFRLWMLRHRPLLDSPAVWLLSLLAVSLWSLSGSFLVRFSSCFLGIYKQKTIPWVSTHQSLHNAIFLLCHYVYTMPGCGTSS